MNEIWKDIRGFEGIYQVSNKGRVRSLDRIIHQPGKFGGDTIHIYPGKLLVLGRNPRGYLHIDLHYKQRIERHSVHRLVALHFLPLVEGKPFINHLDSNPENNTVENLEWCTQSENIQYAYDTGRKVPPHQRPIGQYTEDMKLIKVWESSAQIGREIPNLSRENVLKVCWGQRKHAGGFRWAYIE